jgi:hypothetical protein
LRGVVNDLIAAIEDYLKTNNDNPKPFVWIATAEQIIAKVARERVVSPTSVKSMMRHCAKEAPPRTAEVVVGLMGDVAVG